MGSLIQNLSKLVVFSIIKLFQSCQYSIQNDQKTHHHCISGPSNFEPNTVLSPEQSWRTLKHRNKRQKCDFGEWKRQIKQQSAWPLQFISNSSKRWRKQTEVFVHLHVVTVLILTAKMTLFCCWSCWYAMAALMKTCKTCLHGLFMVNFTLGFIISLIFLGKKHFLICYIGFHANCYEILWEGGGILRNICEILFIFYLLCNWKFLVFFCLSFLKWRRLENGILFLVLWCPY